MQYFQEIDLENFLIGTSVDYAFACEKVVVIVKHANVTMIEYYEYKQKMCLIRSVFRSLV